MRCVSSSSHQIKIAQKLEMFESVLLGNTQTAAGKGLDLCPNSVNWECRKIFHMVVSGSVRNPMLPTPSETFFSWRVLRNNVEYWQGQVNHLKKHFGVEYDTPMVRKVIPTRFKTLRNVVIFERVINGEKCSEVAKDLGFTVAAVLQIWKLVAHYSRQLAIANGIKAPPIPTVYKLRQDKELWLSYLKLFKMSLIDK